VNLEDTFQQATEVAREFNLNLVELDRTNNTLSLRLYIDKELFFHIYTNEAKGKLSLALIFKGERLYGHDAEGGQYHLHPFGDPDKHIFTGTVKPIREFVLESLKYLDEENLL
jgi:hypothetical protein